MKSIELNRCRSNDHRGSANGSSPIDLKAKDID